MLRRLDPRLLLSARLGEGVLTPAPEVSGTAKGVQGAALAFGRWFARLSLPMLSRGQRLQLRRALSAGVPAFLRTFGQILQGSPRLQTLLGVGADYGADLAKVHTQLLRVLGQCENTLRRAEDSELSVQARIRMTVEAILSAAQAEADGGTDPARRKQAARLLDFVRGYKGRLQRNEEGRTLRAGRRVARAVARREALKKSDEPRLLRRELLGEDAALSPVPLPGPLPQPVPRRPPAEADEAPPAEGAPLSRCLLAPPADYRACGDELDPLTEGLGLVELSDAEHADLVPADLPEQAVAVLLAEILASLPWLETAAGTTGAALGALVDLAVALYEFNAASGLLLRGSRDGALVAAELALLLLDQAQEALATAAPDDVEAAELRQKLLGAAQGLDRAAEAADALLTRTARTVARIESEAEATALHQRFTEVVERVATDGPVAKEELGAAVAYKRRAEAEGAQPQAARRSRKRPRA